MSMSAKFVFVFGRHEDDLGNAAQVGDVEEAVMRGAVVAGEAGAIHAEEDGQLLQADVVDDRIEGALEEGGVDGADGAIAARGHACGEDDRVLFGDADIEVALGMARAEEIEAGAVGHGGGDGDDARVFRGQIGQRVGEDLGVSGHSRRGSCRFQDRRGRGRGTSFARRARAESRGPFA